MKILIADDDPQILRALKVTLGARGYDVVTAADGREALDLAASRHPDLVMLDLGMPHLDGVEVIQGLRGWSTVPILVVSGRTDAADKVEALDAGADDYVTKPFSMDELLARIRAQTRRLPSGADDEQPVVSFGDVQVDLSAKTVLRRPRGDAGAGAGAGGGGESVRLTPTEWKILELLLHSPDKLITREAILTEVWGPFHAKDTGYLRLYFAQLRKKLEPVPAAPRHLVTVLGMGYRFVPDGGPASGSGLESPA
ncbi:response regulator [Frigoribacterium sp. Leaf186]|uniref:response regulator n=1 Tax=Frigoribacterium sp. Leaf186 TaxID=1736293 RepID=UPI0006F6ABC6|nr:response regulator transcription factor [Frigoribacterium sp. Leaf186]KQS16440.1 two-component system response regulator [Frigoribacterium sp. Leaf186]